MIMEGFLGVLGAGLSLLAEKEKNRPLDIREKFLHLRKERYEELNKPMERRNNARIDELDHELRELGRVFSSLVGE
jgi:predicted HicB family RNase H-like nuclease